MSILTEKHLQELVDERRADYLAEEAAEKASKCGYTEREYFIDYLLACRRMDETACQGFEARLLSCCGLFIVEVTGSRPCAA